jgi:uncharacterized protein DUF402
VRRFAPGHTIALRQTWAGRVWSARPARVVQDEPGQTMLFIPIGVRWMAPFHDGERLKIPQAEFELVPLRSEETQVLSFAWPDTWYAVLLFLRPDGEPANWYVNLEEPLRRTELGFDSLDHELDVVVGLDGSWRWKDEDELAEAIRRGVISAEDEGRLRADGERAVRRIVDREPPFDLDWTGWRPDPAWPIPVLPDGWDRV